MRFLLFTLSIAAIVAGNIIAWSGFTHRDASTLALGIWISEGGSISFTLVIERITHKKQ